MEDTEITWASEENFKNLTKFNILRLKREDIAYMRQEENVMKNNGSRNKKELLSLK